MVALASAGMIWPIDSMENLGSRDLLDLFRLIALRLSEARRELGALDGAIGDADHGNSMAEGFAAVVRAASVVTDKPPAEVMTVAGRSFLSAVGATTGPLYASAMLAAAQGLEGRTHLSAADVVALIPAFADGIARRGKANPGDKTMMDVWAPAARAVSEAKKRALPPIDQLRMAKAAAEEGRESTRAMIAAVGRAARLGPRSLGHVDPGAASAVIVIAALHEWLTAQGPMKDGKGH
jgi:phosphoenolpyruvate---glycerone phosphotransferase subunit DhaL